ncbi:MAG: xanthine dehydrogenase accessory protein XdhC [Rhizobiales bacterium]|nr:xanthine dehydrogenase accessory protein XdhC [Hyphomicrobiales bacterium]
MKIWAQILKTVETHGRCALVSVLSTQGSAPRDAGAHMVVTPEGYHGSIGGGTLEWHAIAAAQAMLAKGPSAKMTTHALGPDLGQCCGGRVSLATEVFDRSSIETARVLALREAQGPFTITRHNIALSFGEERRRIYLFGAGHVGRALVLALAPLPFDVNWIDPRPDAFPRAVPPNVTLAASADLTETPEGSFVFIMSHSHALDLAITGAALRNAGIAHVGLIGSATKRARFEKRLREAGIAAERVDTLICPIGVPGIQSKEPAAIAAATAAQIIMLDEALRLATADEKPHHGAQRVGERW